MAAIRTLSELEATPHANVFPDREPKAIKLGLEAGEEIPRHTHPDREIVLYLVEGHVELRLGEESHELETGGAVSFDGDQEISPRAIEDSTALIVLAERTDDG